MGKVKPAQKLISMKMGRRRNRLLEMVLHRLAAERENMANSPRNSKKKRTERMVSTEKIRRMARRVKKINTLRANPVLALYGGYYDLLRLARV
jgi:hypothetical protein